MEKTFKSENATVIMKNTLEDWISTTTDNLADVIGETFMEFLSEIEQNARSQWLVRAKNSKNSRDKFETGIRITGETISGFIKNTAPYAWAIKVGKRSETSLSKGTMILEELVKKPILEKGENIGEKIAESIARK